MNVIAGGSDFMQLMYPGLGWLLMTYVEITRVICIGNP